MQSSLELVNVQHLTRQSLPAAPGHQLPILQPTSEAVMLSLPFHNASFELMTNLSVTVVKVSF